MNYLKYVIDNLRTEDYTPEEYHQKVSELLQTHRPGIRGTNPDIAVVDDVIPENPCLDIEHRKSLSETMMEYAVRHGLAVIDVRCTPVHPEDFYTDLTGFPNPKDLVDADIKFANCLTMGERRRKADSYGLKNLYHWNSKVLEAHGQGDIIVMAPDVEKARDKVYDLFKPLEDGNPFEDHYLQLLKLNDDEDFQYEYTQKLNELMVDLNKEPTIVTGGVICIRGSD